MIEILYGPIASGKSTYARHRAEDGAIILSDDAITTAVHAGDYLAYQPDLKPLYKSIGQTIFSMGVALGCDIVVDSTALKLSTRTFYRLVAKTLDQPTALVFFRAGQFSGAADGERRYKADSRGYTRKRWRLVGEEHAQNVETPTHTELSQYSKILSIPWREECRNED